MSQNNIPNSRPFEPMRQPIHFYATQRNSMNDMYHGLSHMSSAVSPTKYFSSKISPIKLYSSTIQNRSPETQFNIERVLNSSYLSKYAKFTGKIQMLEKNLNRLNGQHESLLGMFERSEQLVKTGEIFGTLDKLKERLQQSKRNKHIEEKRYQARHEVVYDDWTKRFQQLGQQPLKTQPIKIIEIQQCNKTLPKNTSPTNIYDTLYSYSIQKIQDLNMNAQRYLNELDNSLKKQASSIIKKHKVQERIKLEQQKIYLKKDMIKLKIGQLKCMTEYQMFLCKEPQLNQQINKLRDHLFTSKAENQVEYKQIKMNQLQFEFTKEQLRFVTEESLDRIMYEMACVDSKFVKLIQQYQTKNHKTHKHQKHQLNPNKKVSSNHKPYSNNPKLDKKQTDNLTVQKILNQLTYLGYQLSGLSQYYHKSIEKLSKIQANCLISTSYSHELKDHQILEEHKRHQFLEHKDHEFLESMQQLQQKMNILKQNLTFFNSNCSHPSK